MLAGSNVFAALAAGDDAAAAGRAKAGASAQAAAAARPATPAEAAAAELEALLSDGVDVSALRGPVFPPRGFVNTGNSCFVNSPMQALLGCPPFCALLARRDRARAALDAEAAPTLHALAVLASQLMAGVAPAAATTAGAAAASNGGAADEAAANGSTTGAGTTGEDNGGWSEVQKPRGRRGKAGAAVPLSVFNGGAATGPRPQPAGRAQRAASGARTEDARAALTPSAAAAVAALWSQPVVPSSLHDITRKFSPEYNPQDVLVVTSGAAGESSGRSTPGRALTLTCPMHTH